MTGVQTCALPICRFLSAATDQQLSSFVLDEGDGRSAGIEIIGEAAIGTSLRFRIVFLEQGRTALGTMAE